MDKLGLWVRIVVVIATIGMIVVADTINVY